MLRGSSVSLLSGNFAIPTDFAQQEKDGQAQQEQVLLSRIEPSNPTLHLNTGRRHSEQRKRLQGVTPCSLCFNGIRSTRVPACCAFRGRCACSDDSRRPGYSSVRW